MQLEDAPVRDESALVDLLVSIVTVGSFQSRGGQSND